MPTAKLSGLVTRLGHGPDAAESATDADLLQRFAANRDEAAFAELVRRHGRLVYGVCRRVTGSHHLAEDAFQAVFVVLAAKAASIRPPSAVAAWLHGVACRTALRARTMADRRRRRETPVGVLPEATSPEPHAAPDAVALLDEEIAKLPDHHRQAVVLCELEGVGRKDAARRLGIAEGTLSSRLAAARRALADRLRSRGVALSAAGLSAAFAEAAGTNPPSALAAKAAAVATPASVPASVAALSQGVLRIMFLNKLKLAVPLAAAAVVALAYAALAGSPPQPSPPKPARLALGAGAEPAKAEPQGPRASRLVVWRKRELVSIDPDGKNEKVLLKEKEAIHPYTFAVSPDGTKVAGVSAAKENPARKGHLVVYDVSQEGGETDLGEAGTAHWSADGKELIVSTFEDAKKPEDVRVTHEIVTIATKKRTAVKLPADHLVLGWSRDGRIFLTMKLIGGTTGPVFDVYLMNRDGTEHKRLNDAKAPAGYSRMSPDAKRVLCLQVKPKEETPAEKKARDDAGGRLPVVRELVVIDVATAKASPVADVPINAEVQSFCWSPDGKKIAYTWRETHEGEGKELKETTSTLVVCDPDGKNQKAVLTETAKGPREMTLVGVDWQYAAEEKTDAEKLAGTWKIVDSVADGGNERELSDGTLTFAKDKVTLKDGNRTSEVAYKLDTAKKPKWIDLAVDNDFTLGIYELDGDTLKICLNEKRDGKRPDKFISEAGTPNDLLIVLKREK